MVISKKSDESALGKSTLKQREITSVQTTEFTSLSSRIRRVRKPEVSVQIRTWDEALNKLGIVTFDIPWNASGSDALRLLRQNYGKRYQELFDSVFDEVCCIFSKRSSKDQLCALGAALLDAGLRFGYLAINPLVYQAFLVENVDTKSFQTLWKDILSRHQFFDFVQMFTLRRNERYDLPAKDVLFPIRHIQMTSEVSERFSRFRMSDELKVIGGYLFVQMPAVRLNVKTDLPALMPHVTCRVYDLQAWPLRELNAAVCYNPAYIDPYSCEFETESGQKCILRGYDLEHLHFDNDTLGSVNNADSDAASKQWNGISLDGTSVDSEKIPTIRNAEPIFVYHHHVVFNFSPEVSSEMSSKSSSRKTSTKSILLDYNWNKDKWAAMEMPNFYLIGKNDIFLYKNKWLVIPDKSISASSSSYVVRFWDPMTNSCYRIMDITLGGHVIKQYIPINDDMLFFLDDGRLIVYEPFVDENGENVPDLVAWLAREARNDMSQTLDAWSSEVKREYDCLDDEQEPRFSRFRMMKNVQDQYKVRFANGLSVVITIEDEI